jgi:hypothetical protein
MLLKAPDAKEALLVELDRLARVAPLPQKRQIAEEGRILRAGLKGEQESAYLLDFGLKASRNTAIIHDLRLDLNGRVAQIDHLLLHRTLNVFVLETKHFQAGLKITEDGEFLRWNASTKTYEGMPSPLAQNERHVAVLKDAFDRIDLPTRLGVRLTPVFLSYVLVSPRAWIKRPKRFDSSHVLKADMFSVEDELNKRGLIKGLGHLTRLVGSATLRAIGRQLVALHTPATIDYAARFGIAKPPGPRTTPRTPSAHSLRESPTPPTRSGVRRLARPTCRHCGSEQLALQPGRFSYHFRCAACNENTPIHIGCGKAGHRERIRQDGRTFYRECPDCRTRSVFFVNPPSLCWGTFRL